jgi:hypothetical protein
MEDNYNNINNLPEEFVTILKENLKWIKW